MLYRLSNKSGIQKYVGCCLITYDGKFFFKFLMPKTNSEAYKNKGISRIRNRYTVHK